MNLQKIVDGIFFAYTQQRGLTTNLVDVQQTDKNMCNAFVQKTGLETRKSMTRSFSRAAGFRKVWYSFLRARTVHYGSERYSCFLSRMKRNSCAENENMVLGLRYLDSYVAIGRTCVCIIPALWRHLQSKHLIEER